MTNCSFSKGICYCTIFGSGMSRGKEKEGKRAAREGEEKGEGQREKHHNKPQRFLNFSRFFAFGMLAWWGCVKNGSLESLSWTVI